ncbi:TonB-dependent receptor [Rhodobacteraceae bacterium RKSG542]|uniref:TonB-dependent receptor plug domain-containing protein n=1 Tax=Pseudovibrio flavus TaxID=2529854 RepID=UPI0012BCC9EE|nr:TonB-dependent receptor [Pseudovibrio flavus]MTI15887.1 TonB-dependent receptor [Pseudovibrio flavus]
MQSIQKKSSFAKVLLAGVALPVLALPVSATETIELDTIVVSANRTETDSDKVGSSVTVIDSYELAEEGSLFIQDFLSRAAGISMAATGGPGANTTLRMRGLNQNYIQVRVDGIDMSDTAGTQVSTAFQHLLTNDVERIEILRGSQSALYGGQAIAGVINIETKRAAPGEVEQTAQVEGGSYDTVNVSYGIKAGFERGDIALNAQHYQTSGFSSLDEDEHLIADDDGYKNTTLSGRGSYDLTDTLSVYGAFRYSTSSGEFDDSYGPNANSDDEVDYDLFAARAGVKLDAFDGRLQNDLSYQTTKIDREYRGSNPSTYEGKRHAIEYLGNFAVNDNIDFIFGGDWKREDASNSYGLVTDSAIWGGFGQVAWRATDALTFNLSGRHDQHSEFGGHNTWRFTGAYNLDEATTLRTSVGTGFRAPSNYELYDPYSGNADLQPETSISFDAGIDRKWFDDRLTTSLTYFHIKTTDLIEWSYDTYRYKQLEGDSVNQGVEVSTAWTLNDYLALSASYTYTHTEDPNGKKLARQPEHQIGLGSVYTPTDQWTLALNGVIVNDTIDTDGKALDNYFLLNGQVSYELEEGPTLYLRAENILDQDYQTARGYGTAGFSLYAGIRANF